MTFSLGSTPRSLVKYNNQSISAITDIVASAKDDMVLIKELTASSSATLDFVDGTDDVVLDSTYPIYKFVFINIHPSADSALMQFQGNAAGGSGYNETITSTAFHAYHDEANTTTALGYNTSRDQAQGTGFQTIIDNASNDNDHGGSGYLYLFNPSSTTFVKHYIHTNVRPNPDDLMVHHFGAGYFNSTSAIDEIQFKMDSGNIDAGTIKLYGIKDS